MEGDEVTAKLPPLNKYPKIRDLVLSKKLCLKEPSHLSKTVNGSYDELAFIEYYLNISKKVKNGNKLIDKLFEFGKTDLRPEQWHSLLSEFAAFFLVTPKLSARALLMS